MVPAALSSAHWVEPGAPEDPPEDPSLSLAVLSDLRPPLLLLPPRPPPALRRAFWRPPLGAEAPDAGAARRGLEQALFM